MKLAIRSNRFFQSWSLKVLKLVVFDRTKVFYAASWSCSDAPNHMTKRVFQMGSIRLTHPRRPRGSQSGWGKARRKFSSTSGRTPGYLLSADHFQAVKQMLAPDWAQKMLCIIVPNRRRVSPEFFSWVRTRRLLSLQTYRFVHQACSCKGNFHFLLS